MKQIIITGVAFFLFSSVSVAETGKVIGISDGDTVKVLSENKSIVIRLARIDCPEEGQEFSTQAKKMTSDLAFGKQVQLSQLKRERYGRYLGEVTLPSGLNLSEELVRRGFCWWYRQYAPKDKTLAHLEEVARVQRLGVWSNKNPTPPWIFRKSQNVNTGAVKKSKSGICHTPGSFYYHTVKKFQPFDTIDECLSSGGRLPKDEKK